MLERNNRVFNSKRRDVPKVVDSIVWSVSMWAIRDKVFKDVSVFALYLSWEACFRGNCCQMYVHHSLWFPPPTSALQLDFYGGFLTNGGRGGYGDLIRDSMGSLLCSYSGPVLVSEF